MPATRKNAVSRTYKACVSCRKKKIRCDLGESNRPPCQRCRREMRDCNIPEERSWKRQTPGRGQSSGTAIDLSHHDLNGHPSSRPTVASPALPPPQDNPSGTTVSLTPAPEHTPSAGLEDTIIRTAVTSGNDALGLLFRDVRSGQTTARNGPTDRDGATRPSLDEPDLTQLRHPSVWRDSHDHSRGPLVQANDDVKRAWSSSKLGQMGWLRAHEVVSLLDSFFREMAPFTPMISDCHHTELRNHVYMISKEPLLCAVILMISSRYNFIPGSTSPSHASHIHSCIWRYCQKLVTGLIFGQSRTALGGPMSYGMILALLLLCEWHPRAFHFSPDADGLGGFAASALDDDAEQEEQTVHERWLSQIHEAVQCSDRMSTMLVGCTLTLSHELHVFDDTEKRSENMTGPSISPQRPHVCSLVYLYTHLLADKPSFTSLLPETLSQSMSKEKQAGELTDRTHAVTQAWLELSSLWRSFREMAPLTKLTGSGSTLSRPSLSLVDHFTSLLTHWSHKHLPSSSTAFELQRILAIEYNYVQIQCNSLGMQIQVERISPNGQGVPSGPVLGSNYTASRPVVDTVYAESVTTHCCALLEAIVDMHNVQALRYAPVRVFMRTVAASVLLLKTLAIGVRTSQLRSALSLLDQVVRALKSSAVDDVHLARHYATLLDSCLQRAKSSFAAASMRQPTPGWASPTQAANRSGDRLAAAPEGGNTGEPNAEPAFDLNEDQWWALPFGPENDIFSDIIPGDNDFQSFGYMGSGLLNFP